MAKMHQSFIGSLAGEVDADDADGGASVRASITGKGEWFYFNIQTARGKLYPMRCRSEEERSVWRAKITEAIQRANGVANSHPKTAPAALPSAPSLVQPLWGHSCPALL